MHLADVTQVIGERYDGAQRRDIVRLLWQVADADGIGTEWERVFVAHVAGAVGISHEEALALRPAHQGG